MTHNDEVRVTVIGRTDRAGTAAANMALSERRAELVRDALIGAGVPSARIDTSWLGEGRQDVPTPDDVAQQRNRVVDIVVQEPPREAWVPSAAVLSRSLPTVAHGWQPRRDRPKRPRLTTGFRGVMIVQGGFGGEQKSATARGGRLTSHA